MTIRAFPWDGGSVSQNDWGLMGAGMSRDGVIFVTTGTQTGKVTPGTGRQVVVAPHRAWVAGVLCESTGSEPFNLSAQGSGSRTDIIGWQVNKTTQSAALIVWENQSAAPANTSSLFNLELASVTVTPSSSSIATGDIADRRRYASNSGMIHRLESTFPTPADLHPGFARWNLTTNQLEIWTGSAWLRMIDPPYLNTERAYCIGRLNGATWPTSTGVTSSLQWTTGEDPTAMIGNGGADRIMPTVSGLYDVNVQVRWNYNSAGTRQLFLLRNGADAGSVQLSGPTNVGNAALYGQQMNIRRKMRFNGTTDYFQAQVLQDSGTTINVSVANVNTFVEFNRIYA